MKRPTADQQRRGNQAAAEMIDATCARAFNPSDFDVMNYEFPEIVDLYLNEEIDSVTGIYLAMNVDYDYKHAVSVVLVDNMNRFERGVIAREQLVALVHTLEAVSVDDSQRSFFAAYLKLVDKVEQVLLTQDNKQTRSKQ
jgi:hypothetical protein